MRVFDEKASLCTSLTSYLQDSSCRSGVGLGFLGLLLDPFPDLLGVLDHGVRLADLLLFEELALHTIAER